MYENRQHTTFITRQAHAPHLGVKMKMLQISADTNNRFNQFFTTKSLDKTIGNRQIEKRFYGSICDCIFIKYV